MSEPFTHMCTCDWCGKWSPQIKEIRGVLSESYISKFDEMVTHYLNIEEDHNYQSVILDGSWPTAIAILEDKLEKAKQFRRDRDMENEKVILDYQVIRNCAHCSSGSMEPVLLDVEEGPVLKCFGCGIVEHF